MVLALKDILIWATDHNNINLTRIKAHSFEVLAVCGIIFVYEAQNYCRKTSKL